MLDHPEKQGSRQDGSSGNAGNALPVLSLPKGGGAISGLGEKFSVNPSNGTTSFSVPIFTTPSRSDFYPKLAMSYDSGSGNGPFGFGWHISIPSVTRKTEKGLPRYRDAEDSDIFILSEAEDLIPLLVESGSSWLADVRTQIDGGAAFAVRRYRPRIEGLFARIEKWENQANGDAYWRSISKDNLTSVYGKTTQARIADPVDPSRVFQWLLEESWDDRGNRIQYEYKAENADNVDGSLSSEANRLRLQARFANKYLKKIHYGKQPLGSPDEFFFQVVFDYGEHDPSAPTLEEAQKWPCRQDAFSNFRAGFEIRTYRFCQRILMFHRFAEELEVSPYLVRSTDFGYHDNPVAKRLSSITQTGYVWDKTTKQYQTKLLPPLEFTYTDAVIDPAIHFVDSKSLEDLPSGLDEQRYQWLDLDSIGMSGILSELDDAWHYKRNLGNGQFAPPELVATKPAYSQVEAGRQRLMDLAAEGEMFLVQFGGEQAGFYEQDEEGEWGPFTTFVSDPNIDWKDPNLRFIDLDGDGRSDILITEHEVFRWYSSRAREGFGLPEEVRKTTDEDRGPALVFADPTQSVFLADMTGDGLTDLLRIRNGEVCYWPNLGYGRFGPKVTMDSAPVFDRPDLFEQRRIRLADIDGSGTTDIVYLSRAGTSFWFNQAGNSWSEPHEVPPFAESERLSNVAVLDLLGNGTACIVWSSPLPGAMDRSMRYIDLMGGTKPYLLQSIKNNLGSETRIGYAASTKFYLQDSERGTPWVTKLPFPVSVVERTETRDAISGNKFVSVYAYHHGYYDHPEREFRGFGMVEQWDTESYAQYIGAGLFSSVPNAVEQELFVPPARTKTWFHTGAYLDRNNISRHFADEYFAGDPQAVPLPDTALPDGLTAEEEEEACRALKGRMLRQEIYADDGSPAAGNPYLVSEKNYQIRQLQPQRTNRYASFLASESESLGYHYERNPSDPRISHQFTLEVDAFGNVIKSASVGYARRVPASAEQGAVLITYSESDFVNRDDSADFYRIGIPYDVRTYEITGLQAGGTVFGAQGFFTSVKGAAEIPYESNPNLAIVQKRLIERQRILYYKDDLSAPLPLGTIESRALPFETYRAAFTPLLLTQVFGNRVDANLLSTEAKYVLQDGLWWAPSGRQIFDPAQFYLPIAFMDPFGNTTAIGYDKYSLIVSKTTDPVNNIVVARTNYRVMQPWHITDANQNRTAVRIDALGMVIATAVMGKQGQAEGDVLDDSTPEISATDDPTTKLEYELLNWNLKGLPNYVHTLAREQHRDLTTRWQESYSYSDGFGREIMKKIQAEPGLAPARGDDGKLLHDDQNHPVLKDTSPNIRWVGTGRAIFNNKGKPVKKYEPFFSSTPNYEDEQELVEWGVTPVLHYDPLARLIRTDLPNGTYSKAEFDAWQHIIWDENDTVKDSRWYADRQALPATEPEHIASDQAAAHDGTPTITYLDVLDRVFLTIADNGPAGKYETRVKLDIEGNQRVVTDARGIQCLTSDFNMLAKQIHTLSSDAGERWVLSNAVDNSIRTWNGRGFQVGTVYDELHRLTHVFVQEGAAAKILAERTVYGEKHPNAVALNLCGKQYQSYDGAGVATNGQFDFKGNLLSSSRKLAKSYQQQVDWSVLTGITDIQQIAATAAPLLQTETFASSSTFDALNRPVTLTTPDQSVAMPSYNEANLLEKLNVALRGAMNSTAFITNLDYNAKGQRVLCEYANGASTQYSYDQYTFRLSALRTTRQSDSGLLQDLNYTYDPVGNITQITDAAQQTIYFSNIRALPTSKYVYDAIYRLTQASGREHVGQNANAQPDYDDSPWTNLPQPGDGQAMRMYTEAYQYDAVGNILQMAHQANGNGWTRRYAYDAVSNRLQSTSLPGDPDAGPYSAKYAYDANGNITQMPHLAQIDWSFKDQMERADLGGGGTAYYKYNGAGNRVRKILERQGGLVEERIYLGGYEVFRRRNNGNLVFEQDTLHIIDDKRRVALVETKATDTMAAPNSLPSTLMRYELGNHLGSAVLEVDVSAAVISYEEFFPYGNTSYQAVRAGVEASPKRYRFVGKERDDETDLYYFGARFYASWITRWISCDPQGMVDGVNLYEYARANPLRFLDSSGRSASDVEDDPKLARIQEENVRADYDRAMDAYRAYREVREERLTDDPKIARQMRQAFVDQETDDPKIARGENIDEGEDDPKFARGENRALVFKSSPGNEDDDDRPGLRINIGNETQPSLGLPLPRSKDPTTFTHGGDAYLELEVRGKPAYRSKTETHEVLSRPSFQFKYNWDLAGKLSGSTSVGTDLYSLRLYKNNSLKLELSFKIGLETELEFSSSSTTLHPMNIKFGLELKYPKITADVNVGYSPQVQFPYGLGGASFHHEIDFSLLDLKFDVADIYRRKKQ